MTSAAAGAAGLVYDAGPGYSDGESKARYLAEKYAPVLVGSVLDVGCGRRRLAGMLPRPDLYVGVDMKPPCDVVVDLERDALPFADASFDAVTCCDVLEHLESAHRMLDECCRVSRSRVIVSLPNPVRDFLTSVFAGSGGRLKYYGFPAENPGNRHRWFFGFEEASEFVRAGAARNGFVVEQLDSANDGCNYWLNGAGEDVLDHPNIKRGAMWAILQRRES